MIYVGLIGLNCIVAKYEYSLNDERIPLNDILNSNFSILGALINDNMASQEDPFSFFILHLVCKVLYTGTHMQMSPFLMEGSNLEPWIQFFKTILDMELPAPEDNCDIIWKLKG